MHEFGYAFDVGAGTGRGVRFFGDEQTEGATLAGVERVGADTVEQDACTQGRDGDGLAREAVTGDDDHVALAWQVEHAPKRTHEGGATCAFREARRDVGELLGNAKQQVAIDQVYAAVEHAKQEAGIEAGIDPRRVVFPGPRGLRQQVRDLFRGELRDWAISQLLPIDLAGPLAAFAGALEGRVAYLPSWWVEFD